GLGAVIDRCNQHHLALLIDCEAARARCAPEKGRDASEGAERCGHAGPGDQGELSVRVDPVSSGSDLPILLKLDHEWVLTQLVGTCAIDGTSLVLASARQLLPLEKDRNKLALVPE